MSEGLEVRDCLVSLRSGDRDAGEDGRARALGQAGAGCDVCSRRWAQPSAAELRHASLGLGCANTGASPLPALTFLVAVLLLFLLLQAGLLLLLLLEQPLLQLPLLVGLEQQVGERAGGSAGGAGLGRLVGRGAGAELL